MTFQDRLREILEDLQPHYGDVGYIGSDDAIAAIVSATLELVNGVEHYADAHYMSDKLRAKIKETSDE